MPDEKQIKKRLKSKTSLTYKLTAYFVVFGIIIGYSVFIFSTAYNGRIMLKHLSELVRTEVQNNREYFADFTEDDFAGMLSIVRSEISLKDFPLKKAGLYIKMKDGWRHFSYVNRVISSKKISIESDKLLQRALRNGEAFSNSLFFGREDSTIMYFSLSPDDQPMVAASVEIKRDGIASIIRGGINELIGLGLILLSFSFLLGKVFASRITKPIIQLAVNAERISKGQSEQSLSLSRNDEIGALSRILCNMHDELSERLCAMEIMNKIDKAVLSSISRDDLLSRVVGFVCDYIDESTVVMALRDEIGGGYELSSAVRQSEPSIMIANPYIPDELLAAATRRDVRRPGEISDDLNLVEVLKKQLQLPAEAKRFYNVPIFMKEKYLGSLLIIRSDDEVFSGEQQQTLKKLGNQVGVALQSVMSVEEMDRLQLDSIIALSRAIDEKSKWTAGHSERVARIAVRLGNAAGLDSTSSRRLMMSALLHDIGKIGVPERILDKPAGLSEDEFSQIKEHPEKGYHIISHIPEYEDISSGIRYHHERWDGSGYPSGLRGGTIPYFGRIIAIADVFDALSADRPYRGGLSSGECLAFIESKKGIDFDPELADLFIRLIRAE